MSRTEDLRAGAPEAFAALYDEHAGSLHAALARAACVRRGAFARKPAATPMADPLWRALAGLGPAPDTAVDLVISRSAFRLGGLPAGGGWAHARWARSWGLRFDKTGTTSLYAAVLAALNGAVFTGDQFLHDAEGLRAFVAEGMRDALGEDGHGWPLAEPAYRQAATERLRPAGGEQALQEVIPKVCEPGRDGGEIHGHGQGRPVTLAPTGDRNTLHRAALVPSRHEVPHGTPSSGTHGLHGMPSLPGPPRLPGIEEPSADGRWDPGHFRRAVRSILQRPTGPRVPPACR